RAIPEHDVLEVAARLGADLESVADIDQRAIGHDHVARGAPNAERETRLEHDGVVPRLHPAPADSHVAAAVGVDPVRVAVLDPHALDVARTAAEPADDL